MNWYESFINESEGPFKEWLLKQSKEKITGIIHEVYLNDTYVHKKETYTPRTKSTPKTLYEIGKLGEAAVVDMLKPYVINNTALMPHAGDISITYKGKPFLVEVKNYSSTVPTKECEKFIRDIETSYCAGGIFISLNTKITGKESLTLEYTNKPCLFVSIPYSQEYIYCCLEIIYKVSSSAEGNLDRHLNKMQNIVYNIGLTKDKLTNVQKSISEIIIELWKQQETMIKSLDSFSYHIQHEIPKTDIDYFNNPEYVKDIVNSVLSDKVIKNGNKYTCENITIEVLKTKVYIYTTSTLTPKKDYIYKDGTWKIPVNKNNYDIIQSLIEA